MIEVCRICYGTSWNEDRSAVLWGPLRIQFGAAGEEVTVDAMLEGGGHTYLELEQLIELVAELYPAPGELLLAGPIPDGVGQALSRCGYFCTIES
jgi:hypothetical protein